MQIFFYKDCNFRLDAYVRYDSDSIIEFFDKNHLNPDEFIISDRNGKEYKYDYDLKDDVYVVYPKIAKGSKGKGWLGVVLGIATILTAGATSGLLGLTVGATKMLGVGMMLSGAGTLVMGQMKMPSMDFNTESATKQNYQWNVGNLSTSRGVKGVTFGNNVTPEGELLAYRTYGTSNVTSQDSYKRYFYGKSKEITQAQYNQGKRTNNGLQYLYRYETVNAYADSDNDGTSWLEMLIGCGEGELDSITDIKINDTPIENIIDVNDESTGKYITRLGSNNQTSLPDTDIDNQIGIMSVSQVMPQKLAGSDNPLIVTTSHACDSILIACQSSVVYKMDTQSGAKNRCFLKPRIGYRLSGSTGAYTYVKTGIKEFDNDIPFKAESAFYFDVAVKFPSTGVYEISLQNLSAEKCVEKGIINPLPAVLPDSLQCAISIDNITLYSNKSQCYPGTALIYLRLPASQALNGSMPRVTWKQSRANCYVWNGSSYVTKPLNNLAWAIYDILAQVRKDNYDNSYHNEGEDVANIDYAKFSLFADFCSNLNIKGNWFLNKLDSAWSTAMSVATSARAFIGTRNGNICPYWDSATEMTQIFTVGNYENMSGWLSAKKSRARAIEATFNDENDSFRSKTIRVEIDDFAADAEAVGVNYVALSTAESVYKAAHYQLRRNKYLCQTVKFTANLDALVCELYDVIGVQCDITKFGVGGRIYAVNGNSISLDAPVTLTGGNYALLVAHDNGTIERMSITEHTGTLTTVTVSGYVRTPKVNEVYSLGVVNNEVKKFRVTSIVKTSDLKCEIEAVEYQPQLYVEGVAPDITYTNPNANISNISTTYNPEGVDIAWHKDVNTAYVDVYVDGVYYGRFAEGATIPNVNSTQQIECVPVNAYGQEGTSVVRAISNSLPSPTQPPIPIVQALPTGAVVQFSIPQNEYIAWIIIKESDEELGRSIVAGDEVTLNLNLEGGTHNLTAYFLNSYGKTSAGRDFTATPFGVDATMLSPGFIMRPQGSILNINAKGCTTESIKTAGGVIDGSGYGRHGQAFGNISIVNDEEKGPVLHSDGASTSWIKLTDNVQLSEQITIIIDVKMLGSTTNKILVDLRNSANNDGISVGRNTNGRFQILSRTSGNSWDLYTPNNTAKIGEWQTVGAVFGAEGSKIYVGGELIAENNKVNTSTSSLPCYLLRYNANTGYNADAEIANVRIYRRELSSVEMKSLYMIPQEAVLSRVTADVIGANAVNAVHLNAGSVTANAVGTNQIITNTANIKDATITDAKISGTLGANRIAANSITADKINVAGIPAGLIFRLGFSGLQSYANGTIIPDLSSHNVGFKVGGTWSSNYTSSTVGHALDGRNTSTHYIANSVPVTIGASGWTFFFKIYPKLNEGETTYQYIAMIRPSASDSSKRLLVRIRKSDGAIQILSRGSTDTTDQTITTTLIAATDIWYNLIIRCTSTTNIYIYLVPVGQANVVDSEHRYQCTLTSVRAAVLCAADSGLIFGGNASTSVLYGLIGDIMFFNRALTENEIKFLVKSAVNLSQDSGTITADRIATDAVKSRNYAYSSGDFSTAGTFLDLANGAITSKNFCIKSDGSAFFKGNVSADSGYIGNFTISGGALVANNTFGQGLNSIELKGGGVSSRGGATYDNVSRYDAFELHNINYSTATAITDEYHSTIGPGTLSVRYYKNSSAYGFFDVNANAAGDVYSTSILYVQQDATTKFGLGVKGKAYCSSGAWSGSDRNTKSQIKQESVINRLKQIELTSWKYDQDKIDGKKTNKGTKNQPKHYGPMAQEFNAVFGTSDGASDSICYTDTIGVALRAIQELANQLDDLKRQVRSYKRILNISDEQIAEERDKTAIRKLEIAKARQAKKVTLNITAIKEHESPIDLEEIDESEGND